MTLRRLWMSRAVPCVRPWQSCTSGVRGDSREGRLVHHDGCRCQRRANGSINPNDGLDSVIENVIDLTAACPPGDLRVVAAARVAAERLGSYVSTSGYHPLGLPELRRELAGEFTARGLETEPEQIIVTSGAVAAMALVAHTLISAGQTVLVENPGYPHLVSALRLAGGHVVGLPVDNDGVAMDALRPRCGSIGSPWWR